MHTSVYRCRYAIQTLWFALDRKSSLFLIDNVRTYAIDRTICLIKRGTMIREERDHCVIDKLIQSPRNSHNPELIQ